MCDRDRELERRNIYFQKFTKPSTNRGRKNKGLQTEESLLIPLSDVYSRQQEPLASGYPSAGTETKMVQTEEEFPSATEAGSLVPLLEELWQIRNHLDPLRNTGDPDLATSTSSEMLM
ncbi:uncharacterized protein ACBR49_014107 [Aulostomus maculatus]